MDATPPAPADEFVPDPEASRRIAELSAELWELGLAESPQACTYLGLDRGLDRLDERGPAARARREAAYDALLRRVEAVVPVGLSPDDRLTRQILLRSLSEELEAFRHHGWEWDLDQLFGPVVSLQDLATKHRLRTPSDAEALVARLTAIPGVLDAYVGDLRDGLRSGRVAPVRSYERVLGQVRTFLATPAADTAFFHGASSLGDAWSAADVQTARARVLAAIESHVRPAFQGLLGFLETEYAGKARTAPGVWSIPGGADAYLFAIRRHTTTTLSAERIHQIGVEELEKNEREMLAIARSEGHEGDLRSFLAAVGRDPRHRLPTREAVLERYRAICARMDARLPELFGTLPVTPYEVRPLEEWREKDAPAAYYQPADLVGARPGIFYANTHAPQSWPTYDMETLCYHEAVPGHHLQIAIAQRLEGIPEFRRHAHFTAYIEGWAHYTERLADEIGMYSTPMDRLGMLAGQAWRAARLVVDTGMHAMKWPRQRAVETLLRIKSGPSDDVDNEIDRYVIWPGQALAYKIGQRSITDARERARRRLGPAFRLPRFHDEILKRGALPLSLLEDLVRGWDGA